MFQTLRSGIEIEEVTTGTGPEVVKGATVTVHLVAKLHRGDVAVDTRQYGMPAKFIAGSHKAIAGLSKGVIGMRCGGIRRIRVSPHLAYGKKGVPATGGFHLLPIPPDALLLFEVELLEVEVNER